MAKTQGIVLPGDRFGRWTVIKDLGVISDNTNFRHAVMVKCDCGAERMHFVRTLMKGLSKSCGCYRRESASTQAKIRITHGLSKHQLWGVWRGMKGRCHTPTNKAWRRYGGRGIKVCDEWRYDFRAFYNWAVDKWKSGLILDRSDNDGNYEPTNCRFVTDPISMRNRSCNRYIEFKGQRKVITDWAKDLGITLTSLDKRLKKWPLEKALTQPSAQHKVG